MRTFLSCCGRWLPRRAETLRLPWPLFQPDWSIRKFAGVLETFAEVAITHARLPFRIASVTVDNCVCPSDRGGCLLHPVRYAASLQERNGAIQPRVLLAAPMSGHFATLLRATVKTMLADHDVYITDWHNVRDVLPAGAASD